MTPDPQYVPIRTPPVLVEWKRVVNDAYLLLTDVRDDAAWQMGVNEWLQHAVSLAERVKAAPIDAAEEQGFGAPATKEHPSSPSLERVAVLEEALRRMLIVFDTPSGFCLPGAEQETCKFARAALGEKADG